MDALPVKDLNLIMESENPAKKIKFQWSIRNVHKIPGLIRSSKFSLVSGQPSEWDMTVSLEDNKTFQFCLTYHAQKDAAPIEVQSNSRILKNGVSVLHTDFQNTNVFYGGDQHPLLTQVKFPDWEDDHLVFQCSMTVHGYGLVCSRNLYSDDTAQDVKQLRDDYLNMMQSREFTDVKMLFGNRHIRAHRCVLKSLAPKFYSYYQQGILEGKFGFVCLHPDKFVEVLHSIYSGTINQTAIAEDVQYFYSFGSRNELKSLVRACTREIINRIKIRNVSTYLGMAEDNGDEELVKYCEAFMKDNMRDMEASLHEKCRD